MKTIKVCEATNAQLDWLVAKCDGPVTNGYGEVKAQQPSYTKEWDWMGPILDRCKSVLLKQWLEARPEFRCEAHIYSEENHIAFGPTLCIAAARCYVISKLGESVEIPNELA